MRTPGAWWAELFDGKLHIVDFRETNYASLSALRAGAYQAADLQTHNVATHKIDKHRLAIQTWGTSDVDNSPRPHLRGVGRRLLEAEYQARREAAQLAAERAAQASLVADCTCGSDGSTPHPPTCAVWG